jgi:hypothetical protein
VPWIDSTWDVFTRSFAFRLEQFLAAGAFGDFDRSVQVIALLWVVD